MRGMTTIFEGTRPGPRKRGAAALGRSTSTALLCLAVALPAWLVANHATRAQTAPQRLPGAAEPGRREVPPPDSEVTPLELQWIIDLPPGVEPPVAFADEILSLEDLVLDGVTAYGRADLLPIFERHLGQDITLRDFYDIAQAIEARYHEDGYLLSFTFVPPQAVSDGVFTIAVVEGYVDKVSVQDVEGRLKATLEQALAPIAESRPLNSATLERYMLLANDLSGIKLTGVLQPSKSARGAAELVVKVEHKPVDGSFEINNRGSEFTGPWQALAGLGLNSLLGLGESLSANATVTRRSRELRSLDLSYVHPFGPDGLRFNANASYSIAEPGFTLERFDVETSSINLALGASYPLVRTREQTVTLRGELGYLDTKVNLLDSEFSRDRIRTALFELTYRQAGFLRGGLTVTAQVVQGLPILGATDPDEDTTSRADAEPAFTKATVNVVHSQPLGDRFSLVVSANTQYSFAPLPAAEEFSLGGERFGRAYNPGEVTGEHGIAVSAELGYDLPLDTGFVERARPYIFYDFGKVWDQDTGASDGLAHSLSSAGLGLRLDLSLGAFIDFEYAYPLTRTPSNQEDGKEGRIFTFLGIRF